MKNLASVFGYDAPPKYEADDRVVTHDIGIGIEIEMEGFTAGSSRAFTASDCGNWWRVDRDGSLRDHGVEFISSVLFGKAVPDALESIKPILAKCNASWRAGIHIHVDIRDLSLHQLVNACILYGMLERLIFAWEGNDRQESNFCIPWYICNEGAMAVGNVLNTVSRLPNQNNVTRQQFRALNRLGKYSALNILPVLTQGSIEFRLMQATQDVQKILQFANICMTIVKCARTVNQNPLLVLSEIGPENFIDEYLNLPFLKDLKDYEAALWQGVDVGNIIPAQANNMRLDNFELPEDDLPLI